MKDLVLYDKCRDLSFNFKWLFKSLLKFSPVIDDDGMEPMLPFRCLHSTMVNMPDDNEYPIYAIEFARFMRVVKKTDVRFTAEEMTGLA